MMLSPVYNIRRLYAQIRMLSCMELNSQWSSKPQGMDIIELTGMEFQLYFQEASKIGQSSCRV